MSTTRHGLLWVDHHEARVVQPLSDSKSSFDITAIAGDDDHPHDRKHDGGHRHAMSVRFADRIAHALRDYRDLVVTGPSTAKDELMLHLRERHHEIAERVSVLKTLDRATDAQLAAQARRLFERLDRMRGIHVPQAPNREERS